MRSPQIDHWTTSLDFKDVFIHVSIAKGHHRYLSFQFGDRYFRFRALPFGLATSPYVFTRLVTTIKTVGTFARAQSLSALQ